MGVAVHRAWIMGLPGCDAMDDFQPIGANTRCVPPAQKGIGAEVETV